MCQHQQHKISIRDSVYACKLATTWLGGQEILIFPKRSATQSHYITLVSVTIAVVCKLPMIHMSLSLPSKIWSQVP